MVKKFPSSRLARADFIFKSVMFTLFDRMKICFILYIIPRFATGVKYVLY